MRQRTKKPTLQVKKETLRQMNQRLLSIQELGQVVGGFVYGAPYTKCCG